MFNFILLLACLPFLSFQSPPDFCDGIILHEERLQITPKEFYIANIIDKRDDRSAVAWLLPAAGLKAGYSRTSPVNLQGGSFDAVKRFVNNSLPHNTELHPLVIYLKKIKITEAAIAADRVEGRASLAMSYNLDNGEGMETQHLTDFSSTAVYSRTPGEPQEIEPVLRHLLESSLVYINNWMNLQAAGNINLAKEVKVTTTDYNESPEGDSVYYDIKRPLTWDDFQSNLAINKYDAGVFPVFGYNERVEVINGVINLHLIVKVCLPKSANWVKSGSMTPYTLNHEQRHFDIVKIVAERFKQKIKGMALPTGNYEGPVNVEYLDAYREMTNLQKQYDSETRHGTDTGEQEKWNEKIDGDLKRYGVK